MSKLLACGIGAALCLVPTVSFAADSLQPWLAGEEVTSVNKLLTNFSSPGAAPGAMIASPSRYHPDYYYNWIRDSALSVESLLVVYENSTDDKVRTRLESLFHDYVSFTVTTQRTSVEQGQGLGEPKFEVDGSVYNGPWARPQNDGPALRALALMHWSKLLLASGQDSFVRQSLYDGKLPTTSVIKTDLEYIAHHWSDLSFGPWEDQSGHILYDLLVMKKALSEGAQLATELDDGGAATFYQQQSDAIAPMLARFWDPGKGYLVDTLDCDVGPSYKIGNIDSSEILGALVGEGYPLNSDRLMATFTALENTFRSAYGINHGLTASQGVAIGRYPGDEYDGYILGSQGNAWPLLTTAFGIYAYRLALQLLHDQAIEVTDTNLAFFAGLPGVAGQALQVRAGEKIASGDARFAQIINALHEKGDAFLATVRAHGDPDGSLSEQFNKDNGYQQGAPDLSMDYAAILLAADARQKLSAWSWMTGYKR